MYLKIVLDKKNPSHIQGLISIVYRKRKKSLVIKIYFGSQNDHSCTKKI